MLQDYQVLRIPGPTPVPPRVNRAMTQSMAGHHAPQTYQIIQNIKPRLKNFFGTSQDILMIAGSGTSSLEAAVVNVTTKGDKVLVLSTGIFGHRFTEICESYELDVDEFTTEWGQPFPLDEVIEHIKQHSDIKAVFSTFCETSTGVLNPVGELAKAVHAINDDIIVIADGVSAVACAETKMDEWGLDIVVTGSQKGFMLPTGLAFIAVSDRAWKAIEQNDTKGYYLDLTKHRDALEKGNTPFTPALGLFHGLDAVLDQLEEEGVEEVYARHTLMRDMTRAALKALDVNLLVEDAYASPSVTAVAPTDFDAQAFRKVLKEDFNIDVASGLEKMTDTIFRIGHMGYCSPADVLQYISAFEIALTKVGKTIELGAGTRAAQEIYLQKTTTTVTQ